MPYLLLKWVHVLAAIVGLGSNLTYAFWFNQPARSPQIVTYILKTIRILDNRMANPAYIVSLITGLSLVFAGRWSLGTPWILTALIIYVAVALLGMFRYGPTLRQQIRLAETTGIEISGIRRGCPPEQSLWHHHDRTGGNHCVLDGRQTQPVGLTASIRAVRLHTAPASPGWRR